MGAGFQVLKSHFWSPMMRSWKVQLFSCLLISQAENVLFVGKLLDNKITSTKKYVLKDLVACLASKNRCLKMRPRIDLSY